MCRSRGGIGGPDPPGKSQVTWVSMEISIWPCSSPAPPGKKLDPRPPGKCWTPLDPWKSIVFSVIGPLDPLYIKL